MYRTFSVSRFFGLLLLDAFIFAVGGVFFLVFVSSADSRDEEAVTLPVLMYHSVCEGVPSEYVVTPEQLESDLQWLSQNGYKTVRAEEVIAYANSRGALPPKPVMLTFDDGYYNNLAYLLPLLEKYDMTAIVSVVGEYTDIDAAADPHVPTYSYLTWEDIRALADSGRVETGAHTYAMHSLYSGRKGCGKISSESEQDYRAALTEDIQLQRSGFTEHLGYAPTVFAYPFGNVSRESIPVLRENGYLMTLTCRELPNKITRDPNCLYGIGRFNRSGLYSTEEYMRKLTA